MSDFFVLFSVSCLLFFLCCRPVWLRLLPLLLLLLMLPATTHPAARTLPTSGQQQQTTYGGQPPPPPLPVPSFNLHLKSDSLFQSLSLSALFPNFYLFSPSHTFFVCFHPFPLIAPFRVERAPCHLR